jgi:hypothetical protein
MVAPHLIISSESKVRHLIAVISSDAEENEAVHGETPLKRR